MQTLNTQKGKVKPWNLSTLTCCLGAIHTTLAAMIQEDQSRIVRLILVYAHLFSLAQLIVRQFAHQLEAALSACPAASHPNLDKH